MAGQDQDVASRDQDARPQGQSGVAATLWAALALLEPPGAWTQGAWARDASDHDLNPLYDERPSLDPVCFCLWGAIRQVWPAGETVPYNNLGDLGVPSTDWNDRAGRTQAEVVEALRKAAELASQQALSGGAERSDCETNTNTSAVADQ